MDKPLVSILINNYNYAKFLREAIDSALNQTYLNTEVVVVDDGSTDNSQDIIQSYGNKIVPILKENGGQASALNAGLAASRGDIICFLDSDDIFLPEKVTEIVNVFISHPEIGWCYHPLQLIDTNTGTVIEIKNRYQWSSREYDLRASLKRGKLGHKLPCYPATSGLCFTRSLLLQIFPLPEAKAITINDNYVKFTAIGLSKGFALARELTIQRIHGANALTLRSDKQQLSARVDVLTAYWMRNKFPFINRFANNIFAIGLGTYWRTGGIESEYQKVVNSYLSSLLLPEKLEIKMRALYHYVRRG